MKARFRQTFIAACIVLGAAPASRAEVVLFPFDDYTIPFSSGLLTTLVPARKGPSNHGSGADPALPHHPVVMPGKPGDPDYPRVYYYGSVVRVNDEYRMWYTGWDEDKKRQVCYAISKDGINWEKPRLGLVEYHGSKENNLPVIDGNETIKGATAAVIYEPEDPDPNRRFKMIREVSPSQICGAVSADGLRWKNCTENPLIKGSSVETLAFIKFNGCYYLNGHGGPIPHPLPGAKKRMMVTYASYDFEHWTRAAHISFRRDEVPPRLPNDFEGHRGEQVHMGASLWNRGNVVLGLYGQMHNESNDRRTSTCDLGLIVSSDAVHFKEPVPDFPIVPAYEEDDGAEARLTQGQGFENIGDRTFFWYGIWVAAKPDGPYGVRVATWPRDRFGYFSAVRDKIKPGGFGGMLDVPRDQPAHFISRPLSVAHDGARIYVNADGLSDLGQLTVEVLDEEFHPIPGYSGSDCVPLTKSGLREPVAWRGKQTLEKSAGPVRIRVNWLGSEQEDALVYAVYLD